MKIKADLLTIRLVWADIVRVLAIYFVVVIHSSELSNNTLRVINNLPTFLSFSLITPSVPLFVMLSGALLLGKKESYSTFFNKRIKKVLIPWVTWTFIFMIWNYKVQHFSVNNLSEFKNFFQITFLSEFWFLPMIFSLYLITPLLRFVAEGQKKLDRIFLIILWFIWVSILPFFHSSLAFPWPSSGGLLALAVYYSGYFFLGFYISNSKLLGKNLKIPILITILGLFITLLEIYVLNLRFNLIFEYFAPNIVITSLGLFSLIFNLYTYHITKIRLWLKQFIIVLSNASFGIFIIHSLLMEIINPYILNNFRAFFAYAPVIGFYIYGLVIFIISLIVVLVLKSIPIVKYIIP